MKRLLFMAMFFWVIAFIPVALFAQLTGEEIIGRVESNQVHKTAKSSGKMIITNRFGTRIKTFTSVAEGEEKMMIEFTNKEERGQKILRLTDEIYLYFPNVEGLLHLQGGALKDSIMGSDFSYEDLTGEKGILSLYNVELLESKPVSLDDYSCYHLKLTGKKPVAYPVQEIWVDTTIFVSRKAAYYSLSGTLLKTLEVIEVSTIKGKHIPVHFIMQDALKKNSRTEFVLEDLQLDIKVPADQFSLERLSF